MGFSVDRPRHFGRPTLPTGLTDFADSVDRVCLPPGEPIMPAKGLINKAVRTDQEGRDGDSFDWPFRVALHALFTSPTGSIQWPDGSESIVREDSRMSRWGFEVDQTGTWRQSDGDFGLGCAILWPSPGIPLGEGVRFVAVGSGTFRLARRDTPSYSMRFSALLAKTLRLTCIKVRRRVV